MLQCRSEFSMVNLTYQVHFTDRKKCSLNEIKITNQKSHHKKSKNTILVLGILLLASF